MNISFPQARGQRGGTLIGFDTKNPHVLGYQRPGPAGAIVCFANVADQPHTIAALTLSGLPGTMIDLLTDARHTLRAGLTLPAHGVVWLRPEPESAGSPAPARAGVLPDGTPRVP